MPRPFGKARQHQATYLVLPLSGIMIAATPVVIRSFHAMFHALPLLGTLHGDAFPFTERDNASIQFNFSTTYFALLAGLSF
jgi:hypothetical protein